MLILILRNNLFERENPNTYRDSLVKDHLLFCKKRWIYCTRVFSLVNANPVYHKLLLLKFLELHQFLQGRLYTELFLTFSKNFHCLVYHIKYHHNRDEVLQKSCNWEAYFDLHEHWSWVLNLKQFLSVFNGYI